jgi:hypothetical protein
MTALILLSEWQMSQVEFWRPIQNFEGYDVSSFGRVRSWWKRITARKEDGTYGGTCTVRADVPYVLQSNRSRPYLQVSMSVQNKRKSRLVHRLVAKAFLSNPENLPQVNHVNCLKRDNRLENLEWISGQMNMDHAVASGLILNGEAVKKSKATESLVRVIRQRSQNGESNYRISQDVDLCEAAVTQITRRRTWKHVS